MAYSSERWSAEEGFVASTASTAVAPTRERASVEHAAAAPAMDPLSGMLLASPQRSTKTNVSAYSPDLCKALKSVVKVGGGGCSTGPPSALHCRPGAALARGQPPPQPTRSLPTHAHSSLHNAAVAQPRTRQHAAPWSRPCGWRQPNSNRHPLPPPSSPCRARPAPRSSPPAPGEQFVIVHVLHCMWLQHAACSGAARMHVGRPLRWVWSCANYSRASSTHAAPLVAPAPSQPQLLAALAVPGADQVHRQRLCHLPPGGAAPADQRARGRQPGW